MNFNYTFGILKNEIENIEKIIVKFENMSDKEQGTLHFEHISDMHGEILELKFTMAVLKAYNRGDIVIKYGL